MVEIFYNILLIRRIARSLGIQFFLHILYSEEAVHGVQGQKGLVPYLQKEKGKGIAWYTILLTHIVRRSRTWGSRAKRTSAIFAKRKRKSETQM
jgi:hypothetical protein